MPPLADRLSEFAAALLDPARPVPPGCVGPDRNVDQTRFAVYRNNVVASLIEALEESFPAVSRIVGEECFRALARIYVTQHPPSSPILLEYGTNFPEFVEKFEPLASLPYLPDVARIERAWLGAYHAAEAISLDPQALAGIRDVDARGLCFTPHPSLRIVRSPYPVLTIWRMNVSDRDPHTVDLGSGGENALVIRREAEVEVRAMPAEGAEFLSALVQGQSLAAATQVALTACAEFDLATHLVALLEGGLFIRYHLSPREV